MTKTFRNALLEALTRTGIPVKAVADGSGVSYEQVKKITQRETASTNVDDAVRIARFFGQSLDEFLGDSLVSDRAEIADLYSRLSPEERAILRAAARGLRDTPQGEDQ